MPALSLIAEYSGFRCNGGRLIGIDNVLSHWSFSGVSLSRMRSDRSTVTKIDRPLRAAVFEFGFERFPADAYCPVLVEA